MKKKIIITGSSRGIGLAITNKLIEQNNYEVIGTSTSGYHKIKSDNFRCIALNLSDENSINKFYNNLKNTNFDFLINNAGILIEKDGKAKIDFHILEKTMQVNFFGTLKLTELLIPKINSGGHIINITSDWGAFNTEWFNEFQPHYKISKAALNMYSKLLSRRLEKNQIKVSALDPGWTQTDMGGPSAERKPEDVAKEIINLLEGNIESGNFWNKGKIREW